MKLLLGAVLIAVAAPAASAAPKFESSLALGYAEGPLGRNGTGMGEIKLGLKGRDASLTVALRHGLDSDLAAAKSRLKFNLDVPLTSRITAFAEVERATYSGDHWGWSGLRFNLNR